MSALDELVAQLSDGKAPDPALLRGALAEIDQRCKLRHATGPKPAPASTTPAAPVPDSAAAGPAKAAPAKAAPAKTKRGK